MKYIVPLVCLVVSLMLLPESAMARHTSAYGSVDTSDLDTDPVDELPMPILFGVVLGDLIPDFGDARGGGTRAHEGQDIRAPQGAPIVSPTEAIVISAGEGPSAGKYVYTANPGGEVFRYMHLDSIADIKRGDELAVGDFIGTVGDTGNAPDGVYHVHLEIRDEDNDPTDPYPRLKKEFTLKEKMSFLKDIIQDFPRSERDEYAEFLVQTFTDEFREALREEYSLPDEIEEAMEDRGVVSTANLQAQLEKLIASIPQMLSVELQYGDSGAAVQLLQLYLIYTGDGPAHGELLAAGPTGYYGRITEAAIREFQMTNDLAETGLYNQKTRSGMIELSK